jgi:para-nitrobenzyl esterase
MPIDGGATPWHCSDIPYVFHNTELVPSTQEPGGVTERLEESIFASVMSFARTGNPSNDRVPEWPACTEETENVMVVDDTWSLRPNFDHELLKTVQPCMMAAFQRRAEEMLEKVQH